MLLLPVHLPGHGPESCIPGFCFISILEGFRGFHNVIHINSRSVVQRPPEHAWQIEYESRHQQNDGHPLVVRDHVPQMRLIFLWNVIFEGKIIRASHPAVTVCIIQMIIGEMCRHPTADGISDELLGTHHKSRHHQDGSSIPV